MRGKFPPMSIFPHPPPSLTLPAHLFRRLRFRLGKLRSRWRDAAFHRTGCLRVHFTRDTAGQIRQAAGGAGVAHGVSHPQRITRMSDAGVQQHAVATQLHRHVDIAGRADTGIDDYRIIRIAILQILQDDADIIGVENALAAADGTAGRHDANCARRLQMTRHDRIVASVDEDLKPVLDELFGGLERGDWIGQQGLHVAETLQLDPVGTAIAKIAQQLAGQPSMANGVLGAEAASRVRQDGVALQIEIIENVAALLVHQAFAAHGHRRYFAAAGRQAVAHQLITCVLAGAGDEPAAEGKLADDQRLILRLSLRLTAADQRNNLDAILCRQRLFAVPRRRHDFAIDLDRDPTAVVAQTFEQLGDRQRFRQAARFAVDRTSKHEATPLHVGRFREMCLNYTYTNCDAESKVAYDPHVIALRPAHQGSNAGFLDERSGGAARCSDDRELDPSEQLGGPAYRVGPADRLHARWTVPRIDSFAQRGGPRFLARHYL